MLHFALLGHNIDYSLSPKIHSLAFEYLNVEADYKLVSSSLDELDFTVERLKLLDGFNITKPHKQNIIKYLSEDLSGCNSVNTVVTRSGKMSGYNTDGYGFRTHFIEEIVASGLKPISSALVLGAGGAAQTVARELIDIGCKVYILNRTLDKAKELCDSAGARLYNGEPIEAVVNCTVLGLNGENAFNNDINTDKLIFAYDTIYSPPVTPFLSVAASKNAHTANGLGMLIYQAIEADSIFLKAKVPHDKLYRYIKKNL